MSDDTSTMSISDTQAQLFGEPSGNNATIETSGRVIRPLMALPSAIVNESKIEFYPDGFSVTAVDPANVAMVDMTAHTWAFDAFDVDEEFTIGVNYDRLTSQLANARMGKATDDDVAIEADGTRTLVTTEREYDRTTLTQTNEILNIDPDSVRQQPDIPDVRLPVEATVDVDALRDALNSVDRVSEHAVVADQGGELVIAGEGDSDEGHTGEFATVANFGDVIEVREDADEYDGGADSKFSLDYFQDMADGLKKAKVDEVTIAFGNGFPFRLEFERTIDKETAYEGMYLLAPRLES